ncbi:MAG: hypothetical protein R2753_10725 [Chitinophagales bacterium]
MNFTNLTRIGLILLFCIAVQNNHAYSQTLTPEDFSTATQVKEELFGFNGGHMMEVCGATTDSIYVGMPFPLEDYHLLESCRDFTNKLNPNVLRFPGGTTANYYHYNGTGYGFQPLEVIGSKFEGMVGADARLPVNYIENFADLCLQTGTKVIYVLNLVTHFKSGGRALTEPLNPNYNAKLQENLAAIDYLLEKGVEVVGVELGNEIYAYWEINGSNGTRNQYMNLARVYTDSIKQRYTDMPVGIPVMPVASLIDIYFNEWNKTMKYANFVDAYIIHTYEKGVMNFCSEDLPKEEYFNCAKEKIDNYLDNGFENNLNYYWTFYGRSKQIWLTEWNILDPQRVANTYLHAYFIQKHWNKLMELEKKHPGDIGFTNCHNFISGGYYYPSVGYQQPNESASTVIVDQFALRSAYYSNLMMSPILKTGNKFIGKTTINKCEAWLYKTENGKYELVINNNKAAAQIINASTINAIITDTDENLGFTSFSSLSADNLYDACGINYYNLDQTNVINQLRFKESEKIENTSVFNLDALSLFVVTIESVEETLPFSLKDFTSNQNNCEVILSWSTTNDRNDISFILLENNIAIDTINSLGDNATNDYTYTFIPDSNQLYSFQIEAFENGNSITSPLNTSLTIDCIPSPEAIIKSTQLNVNDECIIIYNWQVENQVESNSYVVSVTFDEETQFDTINNNLTNSYNYVYLTKENGDYLFQVSILDNNQLINSSTAETITIDCIVIPEAAITSTQFNADENCQITYAWTVENQLPTNSYIVSVGFGSQTTDIAIENDPSASYSYTFTPEENGAYTFQVSILDENQLVSSNSAEIFNVVCIVIPEAEITSTEIDADENCQITYAWTVGNQLSTNSYIVSIGFGSQTTDITIENDPSASYSYTFAPEENGTYTFQVSILDENQLVSSTTAETFNVDCIVIPEAEITSTQFNADENCQITYAWTVENQVATNSYIITIGFGSQTTDIVIENDPSADYTYTLPTEENGEYTFQVLILNENEVVNIHPEETFNLDCYEIPEPTITFTQLVLDNNCNIIYTWRVQDHVESTNFIIATTIGNVTTLDTIASSLASLYSYSYIPEENGEYSFQIALLDGDVFLSATSPDIINVDCIVLPPIVTNFSVAKNTDCSYTVSWSVINEQIGSSYQLSSNINNAGFSPINMQFAFGNFPVFTYTHTFYPEVNGSFDFELKHFMNGNQIATSEMNPINITCAPLPDPILASFQVIEQPDCSFDIVWTVSGELLTSSYKLYTRRNSGSLQQIHLLNATEDNAIVTYTFNYIPELNGSYVFEIEQFNESQLITTAAFATTISCVVNPDPLITNYEVQDNGDCTFEISWTTINELSTSSYTVFVNLDSDSLESIQTIVSEGAADTTHYQFTYVPNINGTYEIVIQQFNEGVLIANPVSEPTNITCILPPDPIASNFITNAIGDCGYQFSWDISGELLTSEYKAFVSIDGGDFVLFENFNATEEVSDISYSIDYLPETNGNYIFKFEQYNNGQLVISHVLPSITVTCVPSPDPFIESFTVTNNGDCTFEVSWSVSNEIASTSYELLYAIEGNTMETIYTTSSNGDLTISNYSYTFVPDENHPYDFQVIQLDNNEFFSTSTIATAIVFCIEIPEPILNSFTVSSYDDCMVELSWDVENQNENTLFVINESYEGGSFSPKDAIYGNADNSTQTFNYSLPVNEAGEYTYNLEIFQNENYILTSFNESTTVYCPQNVSLTLTANPIITFGEFTTTITSNQPLVGEIKIVNVFNGFQILQEELTLEEGVNNFEYNFDNIPGAYSGLYVITFQYNGGFKSTSIIYF